MNKITERAWGENVTIRYPSWWVEERRSHKTLRKQAQRNGYIIKNATIHNQTSLVYGFSTQQHL